MVSPFIDCSGRSSGAGYGTNCPIAMNFRHILTKKENPQGPGGLDQAFFMQF